MTVETFRSAAGVFAALVHTIPPDAWAGPGLGEWDLRSLVGHTTRSLITVETSLARPAQSVDLESPAAYVGTAAPVAAGSGVAERGRQAGRDLGDDPAAAVDALLTRILPLTERTDDPIVTTLLGTMRFSDYLPTRVLELVVHTDDIARALGVASPAQEPAVLAQVFAMLTGAAVVRGDAPTLLRGLTGRVALPAGFSVV